jgi:HEAT repeat protein
MTPPSHLVVAALGRLVSLVREAAPADVQQAVLRRVQVHNRTDGTRLTLLDGALVVDGAPLALPETAELAERMAAHAVRVLDVYPSADATELMAVARALAADADERTPGAAFRARFPPHVGRTVRVQLPESTVAAPEFGHLSSGQDEVMMLAEGKDSYLAFGRVETPKAPLHELLGALDAAQTRPALLHALDALAAFGEAALREHREEDAMHMLDGVVAREAWEAIDERRRALAGLTRRFRTSAALGSIATLLVRGGSVRPAAIRVLAAAGTLGADAIIEALVAAPQRQRRQAFLQALREVPVAAGSLAHMLADSRWYVTRNAAYLVGELRLAELEAALIATRTHADERVRLAVFTALAKLGSPRAMGVLQAAVRDPGPSIRVVAASALGALAAERAVPIVRAALPREQDPDVRAALLGALGQSDSEDAVALLADAAAPGGLLFKRKPARERLAAVHALQRMTQPSARQVLASLTRDRDAGVRAAAAAPPTSHRRSTSLTPLSAPTLEG